MKKVVFRKRSRKGTIRVFVYDQDGMNGVESGTRRDFWVAETDRFWGEDPPGSRVRHRTLWGKLN